MPVSDNPVSDLVKAIVLKGGGSLDPHTAPCIRCGNDFTFKVKLRLWICRPCENIIGTIPYHKTVRIAEEPHRFHEIMNERTERTGILVTSERLHIPSIFSEATANERVSAWVNGSSKSFLVLTGDTGTGKSWQACGALRELLQRLNGHGHLVNCAGLSRMSKVEFDVWSRCAALALDDLGARITPAAIASSYELIEYRHSMKLPTIVTTNMGFGSISTLDERIGSRLATGDWIEMTGDDRRVK